MIAIRLPVATALATCVLVAAPAAAAADPNADMIAAINAVRAAHGVGPVAASPVLAYSAAGYARALVARGYLVHSSGFISNPSFRHRGEVLEIHSPPGADVRATVRHWLRSPPHRTILLSRTFHWIGAGLATRSSRSIWVARFGG